MEVAETVAGGGLLLAMLIAFAAGVTAFLSPCVLPLLPGYLAYASGLAGANAMAAARPQVAKRAERRRMVLGAMLFVLGFTVVFLVLNILVGSAGRWLWEWQDVIVRVMGGVVVVLGLVFMGVFAKLQIAAKLQLKPRAGLLGAPLLGVVFAIGWAPCMGPTLGVVMSLSLQAASLGRASMLALAYCIGLGLPFVLAAFGFGWLTQSIVFVKRHIRAVNLLGGGLLVLIGLLMASGIWNQIMFSLQAVMANFGTIL